MPDVEVQEATDLALGVHLGRLLLEAADQEHLRQQASRQLGVEPGRRRRGLGLSHEVLSPPRVVPLPAHHVQLVNRQSAADTEDHHDDREAHRHLGGGHAHDEEHERLPLGRAPRCPMDTSARLAALSISSMDMKMTSGSRRIPARARPC